MVLISDTFVMDGSGRPFLTAFLLPVLLNLFVGIAEELMFRGYLLLNLAASIGAYITWNLFQGYVYGFPVSGGRDFVTTFIAIQQGGPNFWTGGAFGPEGWLLCLLAFVLGILLMAAWVRCRCGRFTPSTWLCCLDAAYAKRQSVPERQ